MKETIEELWHGNIIPQEDSRTNSPEMKGLLSCIARHHETWRKDSQTSSNRALKIMVNREFTLYHACSDIDGIVLNHRVRISFKPAQSQDLNIVYIFSNCGVRTSLTPSHQMH